MVLTLLRSNNPPVVICLRRNGLVLLDPIYYQFADFGARFVNHRGVLVHREAAPAVNAIVVRDDLQLLLWIKWLSLEREILNALAEWFGEVDVVVHALRDIEVEPGNARIDKIVQRLAGLILSEISRRLFQRILQCCP